MNRPNLLAAATLLISLLSAGSVLAQEATPDTWRELPSSVTRASVHQQAVAALKAGEIERGEASLARDEIRSTRERDQVRAEGREALRLGLTARGELSAPTATPAQAEAIRQAGLRALSTHSVQASR